MSRPLLALIAVLAFGAVLAALVSQHVFDMQPCAWCVLQRLIYLLIGACALLGLLSGSGGRQVPARLAAGLALPLAGAGVAAAWYQYTVAAQLFSCDQTLADRVMTGLGLESGLPWLFGIYATCMDAAVALLGIEYALWSLALFAVIALLALRAALSGPRRAPGSAAVARQRR